jgi:hypothetical protein
MNDSRLTRRAFLAATTTCALVGTAFAKKQTVNTASVVQERSLPMRNLISQVSEWVDKEKAML